MRKQEVPPPPPPRPDSPDVLLGLAYCGFYCGAGLFIFHATSMFAITWTGPWFAALCITVGFIYYAFYWLRIAVRIAAGRDLVGGMLSGLKTVCVALFKVARFVVTGSRQGHTQQVSRHLNHQRPVYRLNRNNAFSSTVDRN
jgi:hypothetical protein